jgi:hypothetical protein
MHFLVTPPSGIHDNAVMDAEQLEMAAAFVDELVSLGVLRLPPSDREVLLTAPLFAVPKPHQPGQWRIIVDMLRGGQNDCVGSDPVVLPRANHMLDQRYEGGYSAVVDLSKYFYNFLTHEDDRPYLGTLHPRTQQLLEYWGLPMGAGNSPAIACRLSMAFLRMLRDECPLFQGKGTANCWWSGFEVTGIYDPKRGDGYSLTREGRPAVRVWGFVDDFLIHGATYADTRDALVAFMDAACRVGFLCHPDKCIHPCQEVVYIGFQFNTPEQTPDFRRSACPFLVLPSLQSVHHHQARLDKGASDSLGVQMLHPGSVAETAPSFLRTSSRRSILPNQDAALPRFHNDQGSFCQGRGDNGLFSSGDGLPCP